MSCWSAKSRHAARTTRNSSCSTPASSTRAATSTCSSSTPRSRPKTSPSASPRPIADPSRLPSPAADRLVSQHLGLDSMHAVPSGIAAATAAAVRLDGIRVRRALAVRRRAPGVVVHGKRNQPGAALRCRQPHSLRQRCVPRHVVDGDPDASIPNRPAPRPRHVTGSNWPPASRSVRICG